MFVARPLLLPLLLSPELLNGTARPPIRRGAGGGTEPLSTTGVEPALVLVLVRDRDTGGDTAVLLPGDVPCGMRM